MNREIEASLLELTNQSLAASDAQLAEFGMSRDRLADVLTTLRTRVEASRLVSEAVINRHIIDASILEAFQSIAGQPRVSPQGERWAREYGLIR